MAVTFAVGLRTCCVGLALFLATARAGEPASPLIGATRDQVLTRYGEPKSQMAVGNRVIFFYPRERIVLRDNVVVEVEEIAADPSVAAPAPPPTTPSADGTAAPGPTAAAPAPPATEPKLEIKLVRPPSKDARPAVSEPKSPPVAAPAPVASPPVVVPQTVPPATSVPAEPAPAVPNVTEAPLTEALPVPVNEPATEKKSADAPAAGSKKADAVQAGPKTVADETASVPEPGISNRTYGVMALVLLVGAAVLFWRRRQRQLELAASSVENTPLETAAVPVITGNGFTAEVLNKLDQKQFEDLVAAYYNKTGVVADRTHSVPEGAVQLKISWKGEPRPFAYVQCLAHPSGAIDPKPLQSLIKTLETDDIRRGYVVTTGRFTMPARELAVEKHLTLLPGDVFLEKLNALPVAARTEIMRSISTGPSAA